MPLDFRKIIKQASLPPRKKAVVLGLCEKDESLRNTIEVIWRLSDRSEKSKIMGKFLKGYLDQIGVWPLPGRKKIIAPAMQTPLMTPTLCPRCQKPKKPPMVAEAMP